MNTIASTAQAGFSIAEWIRATGISHSGFYSLRSDIKPATVKIGKRTIVTEAPRDWLQRGAEMQGATAKAA